MVLDESLQLVTFKNDGFDGAIRFADDQLDNLNSELIITLKIYAVASPAHIAKHGRLESIARLQGHDLIDYYDSKNISSQPVHWCDSVDTELAEIEYENRVYPDGL